MKRLLEGHDGESSEHPLIAGVEVLGMENLDRIRELNEQGVQVIFAPNHVRPNSVIKQQTAIAEDFPKFKKVLKQLGLTTSVLVRGDGDIEIKKSRFPKIKEMLYDFHRRIFSAISRAYLGDAIPIAINRHEPTKALMRNIPAMREIEKTLKKKNFTIFPYGNWFPAREQTFEDLQVEGFVPMGDYQKWRRSLKSGFIRLARKAKTPIVPVYFDNTGGHWKMEFGQPIEVPQESDDLVIGREYLAQMRNMRRRDLPIE